MKLFDSFSTAIREGAKLRPQGFGSMAREGRTCATGAALEAIEGVCPAEDDYGYARVAVLFPYLRNNGACPQACERIGDGTLLAIVHHLNDKHHWTRERIADWLEEQEEALGYVTISVESEFTSAATHPLSLGVEMKT